MLNTFKRLMSADTYATVATADDFIVAGILQSYATELDDWKLIHDGGDPHARGSRCTVRFTKRYESYWDSDVPKRGPNLENSKKGLVLEFGVSKTKGKEHKYYRDIEGCTVNGIKLSDSAAARLVSELTRMMKAKAEADKLAAKVKKEMEENERKWNLAEKLLGMKRTESGALVPINKVEDTCPSVSSAKKSSPSVEPSSVIERALSTENQSDTSQLSPLPSLTTS